MVDIETREVVDIDDFRDPPPKERERQYAKLPPDELPPEEADDAAAAFDEVEEGESL